MRHDSHYVDQLHRPVGDPVGRMISVDEIEPNPNQPRQALGDLSELAASIREKGVLEPVLVRRNGGQYQIIAGERRYRAACEAGLDEVPCVVREADDAEVMELALIENIQRKDLTAFEEADALKALAENHGYTHEALAERLGKSRSSITETLSLTAMPDAVRDLCRLADISSKSLLLQVVRQSTPEKMEAFVGRLRQGEATRQEARRLAREARPSKRGTRARPFTFSYRGPKKSFSLSLKFRKSEVERAEIISTLEEILDRLRSEG
jgi:ParB family chromosome partitioning protein